MSKAAKFFRIVGGLLMLSEICYIFLPIIKAVQENYPTKYYSQLDFLKDGISCILGNSDVNMSQAEFIQIVLFIALPILIAVVFGIISIAAGAKQIISGFAAIITGGLNIAFYVNAVKLGEIYKKQYQTVSKQPLLNIILVAAVLIIFFGIMIIVSKPAKANAARESENFIPDVQKIYEEQSKPKVEFLDEAKQEDISEDIEPKPAGVNDEQESYETDAKPDEDETADELTDEGYDADKEPRGVMVCLSGMYKGAEIGFENGESIKFGRDTSNDMVFSDAPRVSRFHCVITWDSEEKTYQIVDKSSNGCYVNGMEECIPQNIPIKLEVGTILDIGDENNRFRLE